MRKLIPLLWLASLTACADGPTAVVENEVVRVAQESSGIRITNLTDIPRAYLANDPNWLALASASFDLVALCNVPDSTCLRLPAKGSVLVPYAEVGGYSTNTQSIVVWTWRVVPAATPGQYQAEMDEAVTLKL